MKLSVRLSLLMALLTLLPAVPTLWVTNELISKSLDVGLNPQIDGALEAGVRRAREHLIEQRAKLSTELELWSSNETAWITEEAKVRQWMSVKSDPILGELDRVVLSDGSGEEFVLQAGTESIPVETDPSAPPSNVQATMGLERGWKVDAIRPVSAEWRTDASLLASTLQVVRGLRSEREQLGHVFWMPFAIIYGSALLLGLAFAARLGYGITTPIGKLLTATNEVAKGNWAVQVGVRGKDEIARLGQRFDEMVRTLDAQNKNLVDLEKLAGWREMARALAHEVKNPLTPIQLTVEEMRVRYEGDDPKYKQLLEECTRIVIEEVNSLRDIVSRFREFSRPVEPQMHEVDLNALLEDLAAMQKDLKVELDLDREVGMVEADEARLRQVVMNLAQNSRTATADVPEPRLRLSSERVGNHVLVRVEDNGPGIPPEDRAHVFEPYRSGTVGGLGLGLALVKGIVLAHHGTIDVEDGRLGGACIRFQLPRHPEAVSTSESRTETESEGSHV